MHDLSRTMILLVTHRSEIKEVKYQSFPLCLRVTLKLVKPQEKQILIPHEAGIYMLDTVMDKDADTNIVPLPSSCCSIV